MKLLKKGFINIVHVLFVIILFQCKETHKSELLHEDGVVLAKQFRGESNQIGNSISVNSSGGISTGVVTIHENQKFDVVFKCEHGAVFTIDDANVYEKLKEGDSVIIGYKEIRYKDNTIKKYDFIDAERK